MMNELKQLQESFQQYLMQADADEIVSHVVSTAALPATVRLAIYGDAYQSRLIDALASNFSYLKIYLGEDEFFNLASDYVAQHPSIYRSIRWYGDKFPDFIRQCDAYQSSIHIHEIAALDWVMTLVFDAEDAAIISFDQMAAIAPDNWPEMRFVFHPSVYRLQFKWNVVECWQADMNDDDSMTMSEYASAVDWLFWRHELMNHFISLSVDEAWALDAAISGASFAEICEGLIQFVEEDNVAIAAASMLRKWLSSGLISQINY